MSFDHGILNLPLAKRGNIDAQIDAWKADQAKAKAAQAVERAAERKRQQVEAKALVASLDDEVIARIARKAGLTFAKARKRLMSDAHFDPASVLRAFPKSEA